MESMNFNEVVKQFYRNKFNVEYLGTINLSSTEEGDGLYMFICKITLNQSDRPITIAGQFYSLDDFQTYVLKELTIRGMPIGVSYFKLIQTDGKPSK